MPIDRFCTFDTTPAPATSRKTPSPEGTNRQTAEGRLDTTPTKPKNSPIYAEHIANRNSFRYLRRSSSSCSISEHWPSMAAHIA